jgi:hypothetical protein
MHRFQAALLLAAPLVAPSVRAANEIHWTLTGPASVDLSGRRIHDRDLGSAGTGLHAPQRPPQTVPAPGIDWLRLSQSGHSVSSKVTFTR